MISLPLLVLRWENSLERDTEIEHKVRLHIGMRLASASVRDRAWMHHCICRAGGVLRLAIVRPVITCGIPEGRINDIATNTKVAIERVRVGWQLLNVQSDG
jgi:hypothetical protein